MFLPEKDTLVEVKSTFTWRQYLAKNKAKLNAARRLYNVWLLIMNADGSIHKSVYKERKPLCTLPPILR
jgi:hypothetical protein